ncbi:hypothetical protein BU16DRAFT_596064 [Lophium mytilinum]|uniref:Uncharacterized protein n=1 Tax=Lophium mytilinum TaxID=390894 RepID=A0A6A6QGN5_9PEZI|nr:hypothetical protein BU16DRAFT_596064 [Lophium mytilinum]
MCFEHHHSGFSHLNQVSPLILIQTLRPPPRSLKRAQVPPPLSPQIPVFLTSSSIAHIAYSIPSIPSISSSSASQPRPQPGGVTYISLCRNPAHEHRQCSIGAPNTPIAHHFNPADALDLLSLPPYTTSYGPLIALVTTHICTALAIDLDAFKLASRWIFSSPPPVELAAAAMKNRLVADGIASVCAAEVRVVGELDAVAKCMVQSWSSGPQRVLNVGDAFVVGVVSEGRVLLSTTLRTAIPDFENDERFGITISVETGRILTDFGTQNGVWNISFDGVAVNVSIDALRGLLSAAFQILIDALRAQIEQIGHLSTPGTFPGGEPHLEDTVWDEERAVSLFPFTLSICEEEEMMYNGRLQEEF